MLSKDDIFGYREYRLIGEDFERFLNDVAKEAINVHAIRPIQNGITFRAWFFIEAELTAIAENLGLELERTGSGGLPVFLSKYKTRYGIFAGIVITVLFFLITSFFIFDIKIEGNYLIYEEDILQVLEENGLYKGALAHKIDCQTLKLELLESFETVAYAYVNIKGSRAEVQIIEKPLPPSVDETSPCNIIAAESGQIVRFETYKGEACALRGEGVKEGQLLVSGVLDSKRIGYRTVHASALVMARTRQTITLTQPYITVEQELSGREEEVYIIDILGLKMTWGNKDSDFTAFHEEKDTTDLTLKSGRVLPISLTKITRYELTDNQKSLTEDEAVAKVKGQLAERERIAFLGLEIEEKEETIITTDSNVTLIATYTVIKNIAQEQEIYLSSPQ